MKKRWSIWLVLAAIVLALGGCGGTTAEDTPGQITDPAVLGENNGASGEESAAPETADNPQETDAVYPLTVTDASGTELTFEQPPEKVVSIAPSETEVLFAVGAGDRVIAVDDWSDYPAEEVADLPRVGGLQANVEKILELEPDLVVAGWTMSTATIEELRKLGVQVYTFDTNTLDEAIAHIREVGRIMNTSETAEAVAAKMEADRKLVAEAVGGLTEEEKKTVYIEFSPGWTVGQGEFMDELIAEAGGINIADQEGWYKISEEIIIEANPEVILYSAGVEGLEGIILGRSGWDRIDAIENGQMKSVDDNLVSRPGPRITEALVEVAKAIYPEKF